MKAKMYKLKVAGGWLEWSHGMTYSITEYYLPNVDLFFNNSSGLNVFKQEQDRLENAEGIRDVEIPDETALAIVQYFRKKESLAHDGEKLSKQIASLVPKEITQGDSK